MINSNNQLSQLCTVRTDLSDSMIRSAEVTLLCDIKMKMDELFLSANVTRSRGYKTISCSTQLRMKLS